MILSQKQAEAIYYLDGINSKANRILYGGAAGGGKTLLGVNWQIERRIKYPGTNGCIGRKNITDLKKTTLQTLHRSIHEKFEGKYQLQTDGQLNIVKFPNGSQIFLIGTEESPQDPMYERFGSMELTDAFIDEAGESPFMGVETLYSRIRFNLINDRPKLLMASNPSLGWLKNKWIKTKDGKPVTLPENWKYIRATLDDNPDTKFVDTYKKTLQDLPKNQRDRLLFGDWDFQTNESKYYPEFTESNLLDNYVLDSNLPIILGFDFNYDPCSVIFMQANRTKGGGLIVFNELQSIGGTRPLCQKINEWKVINNWRGPIWVTGDSSGHKRDTRSENYIDYDIIQQELQLPSSAIDANNRANSALGYSKDLINTCLYHNVLKITKNCYGLIEDFNNARPKGDSGEFKKDRDGNKLDLLDGCRYAVHSQMRDISDILVFKQMI